MKTFVIKGLWVIVLLTVGLSCNRVTDGPEPRSKQGSARNSSEDDLLYDVHYVPGARPLASFTDPCVFIDDMWSRSVQNNSEYFGVVTEDGYYLITQQTGFSGGGSAGLIQNNSTYQAYYYYPELNNPTPTYNHIRVRMGGQFYWAIPIKSTVHTHTPCITDGTDGVSHPVSSDDANLASLYQHTMHHVVGCNDVVADLII